MKRARSRAGLSGLAVGLAALGLVASPRAHAYRCTRVEPEVGPSLVWGGRSISWWLDAEVAELGEGRGRIESVAAFDAWDQPGCSDLGFVLEGVRSGLVSEYRSGERNRNVVVLLDPWPESEGTIALTVAAFDTATGIVMDADIELNGEQFDFGVVDPTACAAEGSTMDLRNTLTHEVGHVIGLDHPPAGERFADATMFASAPPCETSKRTLAEDDIDGLCAIYPAGLPTRPCFPPDQPGFVVVDRDDGFGCRAVQLERGPVGDRSAFGWMLAAWVFFRRRRP